MTRFAIHLVTTTLVLSSPAPLLAQLTVTATVTTPITVGSGFTWPGTTTASVPVGPLPAQVVLPPWPNANLWWTLSATGLYVVSMTQLNSGAGAYHSGTAEVTLTAPYETTCEIHVYGNYSGSIAPNNFVTSSVTGAVNATLHASSPQTIDITEIVTVGPAGTTFSLDHRYGIYANVLPQFTTAQTWITWTVVDSATTAAYGTGCAQPAPNLAATSPPPLGTTVGATIASAPGPNPVGVVAFGLSQRNVPLTSVGMPGCALLQSAEWQLPATPSSATTLDLLVTLPNDTALVGTNLFTQAFCLAPGANPLQLLASNGERWQLGS